MKENGYNDGQVSERLRAEGRIQYSRKTINTRFQRIRFAQAKRVDEMLLEGYKEWQYEDDVLLMKAKDLADAEIEDTIKRLRSKRFDKVSDYMHKLNPEAIFSKKACKERYIGLVNGTASIPIDLDDNPQKRREELQAYQESREKAREIAKKEKVAKDEAERQAVEAAKLVHAEKAAEAARKRQLNAEYKARREQEKAEKKLYGFKKADEVRKKRDEKAEHKKLAEAAPKSRSSATLLSIKTLDTITPATPDPRAALSLQQLKALCGSKSLSKEGRSKAEFVERLKAMDQKLTLAELKRMSGLKGLNTSANKTNLIHQLALREVDNIKKDATS
ncbi:uncharacterized protein BDZ99DRAFT_467894 [Mytilinidion resinicola]|uniref:DUF7626 domain-containing protein n=1 Tax=Mytilinidion resinicola TaxID=574789 RepID=A0A6A6Y5G2_9PEZI|nr:uncharacterized protein BDZ99DRAFT_467894 [Mytilinidion resinicola]KAF2803763.1 hypothetical protein BDZ99DRAFT_467894 [Mytilinidion resinicola]